ncbi:hypothetical protein ACF0H5_018886 [Mactra antiquata]
MANDYLVSKWKLWYTWFDINKDGKVDHDDVQSEKTKFAELSHLSEEDRVKVSDNWEKWWNEYIFWGKSSITEAEFVELMNNAFKENRENFQKRMQSCFEFVINEIVDNDKSGSISLDEFVLVFKSCGHNNTDLDKKFFDSYNPIDGAIPSKAMIDSWVVFTTSEDSSVSDIVKEAFESGM